MESIEETSKNKFNTYVEYFLLFIIYAFLGWCMEICIFYNLEHRFVNRGFLIGPICSIYGFGCSFITIFFGKYKNKLFKLFFYAIIWCAIIEYVAGYVIEVTFGGRWWNYTDSSNLLNINGRVWFVTTIFFGILASILIRFVEPFLLKIIRKIPKKMINSIAVMIAIVYILDISATSIFVIGARESIEEINSDCTTIVSGYVWEGIKDLFH